MRSDQFKEGQSGPPEATITDEQLVTQLVAGDTHALGELYARYGAMVKSTIARLAPEMGRADVEDLCQEVFLTVNSSVFRLTNRASFKSWLYGVVIRKSRQWRRDTWLRRGILRRSARAVFGTAAPAESSEYSRMQLREELEIALAELSPKLREVFVLYTANGLTGEEISETLGISLSVVWTRLHRARKQLVEHLRAERQGMSQEGESS